MCSKVVFWRSRRVTKGTMAGRERAGTNIETKPSSAAPVQQKHHPATTNALQSERGRPRPPRSKQKPQPLTHERSSVGARPSSAAPVQTEAPTPDTRTLFSRSEAVLGRPGPTEPP